jgi:hypothetical protein
MKTKYINEEGQQVPGVTTVLGVLNKPFLIPWANKLGLQGIDSSKYVDGLAEIGQVAHYLILCHLTGEKPCLDDYSKNTIDIAENSFLSFLQWEKSHVIRPLWVEKPLVSDRYGFGGTPDFVGTVDGEAELMDFKTGKAIYPEYFYQMAAYRQLVTENFDTLRKDGVVFWPGFRSPTERGAFVLRRARVLRIGRTEDEGFEERIVSHLDMEFDMFQHCLAIYNLQKAILPRRAPVSGQSDQSA